MTIVEVGSKLYEIRMEQTDASKIDMHSETPTEQKIIGHQK